jgi:hypothetical protein
LLSISKRIRELAIVPEVSHHSDNEHVVEVSLLTSDFSISDIFWLTELQAAAAPIRPQQKSFRRQLESLSRQTRIHLLHS